MRMWVGKCPYYTEPPPSLTFEQERQLKESFSEYLEKEGSTMAAEFKGHDGRYDQTRPSPDQIIADLRRQLLDVTQQKEGLKASVDGLLKQVSRVNTRKMKWFQAATAAEEACRELEAEAALLRKENAELKATQPFVPGDHKETIVRMKATIADLEKELDELGEFCAHCACQSCYDERERRDKAEWGE